ncbi:hypothetical protein [Bradyrhizobium sp. Arg816]|uniref:hypothetical protein n=1 Tax=Bradyrhizobium sp. Arg816 TaxID=2998491 RepID=UPI00249F923C|nr:hypothetical protein [Bradyrhizobium sp. Arg816]MDI3560215.1 hypothetical protein [Bradyrhizobium sp. Arg816]
MPRGQFYTVFTLGFATAIGLLGVSLSILLFFSGEAWAWAYLILNAHQIPQDWLEPGYIALFVAGAAVLAAYWIVRIQQAIVRRSGDRLIARLNEQYTAIAQTQGREYADEFMRLQAQAMIDESKGKPFNLFGGQKMLHAMSAAGVHVRPPV